MVIPTFLAQSQNRRQHISSLVVSQLRAIRPFSISHRLWEAFQTLQWVPQSDGGSGNDAPLPPKISGFADQSDEVKESARQWVNAFMEHGGVPRKEFEVGYSRSSGPGGQHVNKTSTKATVRLPMRCPWIPMWAKSTLRTHTFYIDRTDALQASSDVHRSQSQNLAECLKKINLQIERAATDTIPKPPDLEKQKRIAKHEARFERANKEFKQQKKMVKQGRGKVKPDW
ncbi:RF-1 domain protein [Ceratobasidium sp. AG-Ba]|nr:RF-1 domain protein [Ceratobasidium sp. AG-Ba]